MTDASPAFRGYHPTPLRFGTSGLRGLVSNITDLETYLNARGFLDYLHQNEAIHAGQSVCLAGDLRPSTDGTERSIMRAVARAIMDAGLVVENLGKIPTPALTYYALREGRASVMVTGSHIPFDRNGIKFNKPTGEVLKSDEGGILQAVAKVRESEYAKSPESSLFQDDGMFKPDAVPQLPAATPAAADRYLQRYLEFFPDQALADSRIAFFEHSAVGRDLIPALLRKLGAQVIAAGRSEEFIAIDTEDITAERLEDLQELADTINKEHGPLDAVVSTDGDSDRPLLLGLDAEGKVRFVGGDLLGLVVAEYLEADIVAVPISANDAVDIQLARREIHPIKTRIGSPHVILAMQQAAERHPEKAVVGWEANGGFLVGSPIRKDGRILHPLPTRDSVLPILSALCSAREQGLPLVELFTRLPKRFSKAGLIDAFPQESSQALIRRFSPKDPRIQTIRFEAQAVELVNGSGESITASENEANEYQDIQKTLQTVFRPDRGFDEITAINFTDGIRVYFQNGDIAHIRPSGNAPQLRLYAVAHSQLRADEIVRLGLQEPDGLLRSLERLAG